MSDYEDFCRMAGGSANDPELLDKWLAEQDEDERLADEYGLTHLELTQIKKYIEIFQNHSFSEHRQVNNYITDNELWNQFSGIRSLNDHGQYADIPGILPKFYKDRRTEFRV